MYSLEILQSWELGNSIETVSNIENKLLSNFLEKSKLEIPEKINLLSGYHSVEDKDDVLNKLYRFSHLSQGLCNLFHIQKLKHLYSILDFIFDTSRNLNTIHIHSFDYLSKLILDTILEITNEFINKNSSSKNISLLIEESKVYLQKPIEKYLEKQEQSTKTQNALMETKIEEMKITPIVKIESVKSIPEILQLGDEMDEPEELNIPIEKITLISDFYEESYELLAKIENKLIELEDNPVDIEILNDIFRSLHTIKGGTRILKVGKMEKLSHGLEDLLDKLRKKTIPVNAIIIDILMFGKKLLSEMLDEVASKGPIRTKINSFLSKILHFQNEETETFNLEEKLIKFDKILDLKKEIHIQNKEDISSNSKTTSTIARVKERQVDSIRVNIRVVAKFNIGLV